MTITFTPKKEQIEAERELARSILTRWAELGDDDDVAVALATVRLEGEAKGRAQMEAENERLARERDAIAQKFDELHPDPALMARIIMKSIEHETDNRDLKAENERLRAECDKLLSNAKQDANLLRRYHAWCELKSCAPSTSDLYQLVLMEPMP